MRWIGVVVGLWVSGVFAQHSSHEDEVIGEEGEQPAPTASVPRREEAIITVNGKPFTWADPLIIEGGKTYNIHITGLRPNSKVIIRLFKAGQSIGHAIYDSNELGELELEATLRDRKVKGTAEVIYYPSSGKEVRRRFAVEIK
ncbi:MAG: hypothetical protein NZ580_01415 [Bacteroidia bacterium]|nr:hypothetical protein [Bacteroidia bacterium]MDW8235348.1 hypothetical protein [Bacteroidia bacterium]